MLTSRPTHGGGAPLGIDLDAGIAKITVRRPAPVEPTTEPADDAVEATTDADGARGEDEPPTS